MSIRKLHGKWYIDFYISSGRRIRKCVGESKKRAKQVLRKSLDDVTCSKYILKKLNSMYFKELADKYMERHAIHKKSYKNDKCYVNKLVLKFGNRLVSDISTADIEEYRANLKGTSIKNRTINMYITMLSILFKKAQAWDVLSDNPISKLSPKKLPEDEGRVRYLKPDEFKRLMESITEPHLEAFVMVALYTGIRKSKVLSLKWEDIDFGTKIVSVNRTKNNTNRYIPLHPALAKFLQSMTDKDTKYIVHYKHKRILDIKRSFSNTCRRAGIKDFRPHDLRHTYGSYLAFHKVHIRVIQQLLGHKKIEMTQKYTNLSDDMLRDGVESLDYRGSLFGRK